MSKRQMPDTGQLQHMNVLLEAALELPEDEREAWLDALPPQHRALTPSLRVLLQRATEETDGFMRRSVGWLRWPQAGSAPPPAAGCDAQVGAAAPASWGAIRPYQVKPSAMTPRSRFATDERSIADALRLAERALVMAEISRGGLPHSASSGEAWLAVARARHAAGDAAAARDACARAVRHFAVTVDDSHPSLVDARALMALLG